MRACARMTLLADGEGIVAFVPQEASLFGVDCPIALEGPALKSLCSFLRPEKYVPDASIELFSPPSARL